MDEKQKKEYQEYVKQVTPTHNLWLQMLKAFLVGGTICVIGQVILNTCAGMGLDKEASGGWSALILILLSVLLTGFNIYPSIVKWGGAGALVPITGFANSVAAPAIEFKKRRTGFRCGLQDFHHCRAGYPVWNFHKLGAGGAVLAWRPDGLVLTEKCFQRQSNGMAAAFYYSVFLHYFMPIS